MPGMPWIKLWPEMLDDPKIFDLPDERQAWRFVQLIMMAGDCDAAGAIITGDKPMTLRQIAKRLRIDLPTLEEDVAVLVDAGLIMWADKTLVVTKFSDRQGPTQAEKRQQWKDRQQKKRERANQSEQPSPVTPEPVTQESRVTLPLEEEEEEEEEEVGGDKLTSGELAPYADIWTNETKIPQFRPDPVSFLEDLKKVKAAGVTVEDWRAGIRVLVRKKYHITRPMSCLNAAIFAMAERARGSPGGNGEQMAEIEQLYPTYRAGAK